MAKATKCPKCGLMQMGASAQCKKCGAPLEVRTVSSTPIASAPAAAVNPYAPPQASSVGPGHQASEGLWRDGKTLVATHAAEFPDRCVKCNQPAGGFRLKRNLTWHPSAWYALILINLIVYAVVATIIQKKTELHVGFCDTHRKRRLWSIGIGLTLPLLGAAGCTLRIEDPASIWIGMGVLIVGMVILIAGTSVLAADVIDERFARIRGASTAFLASLPPFHGHR